MCLYMKEIRQPAHDEYPQEFIYKIEDTAPCVISRIWADCNNSVWLESVDGQHIVIPMEIRKLLSKRIREI